jgi:hypothetical protein
MDREADIRTILRGVVWDYAIDPYDLYLVALGEKDPIGFLNKERALSDCSRPFRGTHF